MKNELFRKSSIERISSPEQLDDYMKVSNPSAWVILLALLFIMVGTFYWGVTGTMPSTTSISGVIVNDAKSGKYVAYSYTSLEESGVLEVGMEAQVSPVNASRTDFGYIEGKVAEVGTYPVTIEEIAKTIGSESLAQNLITETTDVQIKIELEQDPNSENGLKWSNSNGNSVKLRHGLVSTILVTTDTTRPLDFVLNKIKF